MEFEVFKRKGGTWLGAAHDWIKNHCIRGDSVICGSDTKLVRYHGELTVKDVEEISAKVGYAVHEKVLLKVEGFLADIKCNFTKEEKENPLVSVYVERQIKILESLIRQIKEDI